LEHELYTQCHKYSAECLIDFKLQSCKAVFGDPVSVLTTVGGVYSLTRSSIWTITVDWIEIHPMRNY